MPMPRPISLSFLTAMLLVAGCEKPSTAPTSAGSGSGGETSAPATGGNTTGEAAGIGGLGDSLADAAAGAAESAKAEAEKVFVAARDQAVRSAGDAIDALKTQFASLEGASAKVPLTLKPIYDKAVSDIGKRLTSLSQRLGDLRNATPESWQGIRDEVMGAVGDLKGVLEAAIKQFGG